MKQQMSFAQSEYAGKKKMTRRERFLGEMEKVVPWARLVAVIEPHYPQGKRGRPPIGIERMLRIYFLQQWYALADEALEDALYDSQAMRSFAGIDLSVEAVPDATTLLKFRHLLEAHELTQAIFGEVSALLEERKLLMKAGTIVDATIIAAPASTKTTRASAWLPGSSSILSFCGTPSSVRTKSSARSMKTRLLDLSRTRAGTRTSVDWLVMVGVCVEGWAGPWASAVGRQAASASPAQSFNG